MGRFLVKAVDIPKDKQTPSYKYGGRVYIVVDNSGKQISTTDYKNTDDVVISYKEALALDKYITDGVYHYIDGDFSFSIKTECKTKDEAFKKYESMINLARDSYLKEVAEKKEKEKQELMNKILNKDIPALFKGLENNIYSSLDDITIDDEIVTIVANEYKKSFDSFIKKNTSKTLTSYIKNLIK